MPDCNHINKTLIETNGPFYDDEGRPFYIDTYECLDCGYQWDESYYMGEDDF